jgi:CheY-like chemotaxis protein
VDFESARSDLPAGAHALLVVSDTGTGMDRHTRDHLFEPFFTTKAVGRGTGLGLSIVYGIVKSHRGDIHAYSEPGAGTVFRIFLPLIPESLAEVEQAEQAPLPRGTETVLLVEDEVTIRQVTRLLLEDFGYTVVEAADCDEAVVRLRENLGQVQLVLSDLIMPKKNGRETFEALKAIKPELKVLFMSGYTADLIEQRGILERGLSFIQKPMRPAVLLRKIREVLES